MMSVALQGGAALLGRAISGDGDEMGRPEQLPGWVFLVVFADFIIALPMLAYVGYTLAHLFPVLAIVENIDPPAYEPVALTDEADNANGASGSSAGKPISSSLRSLGRLLYSVGGWRASFRGLGVYLTHAFAVAFVSAFFDGIPFVPSFVGTLAARLALVQLSAVWVHIAISPPNPAGFWRRLPPFRKAFEATWIPTLAAWAANTVTSYVPVLAAYVVRLPLPDSSPSAGVPEYDRHAFWKVLLVLLVTLLVWALVVVPAEVLLTRVQASLLPPDEDAIVPFDRTYDGTLEPAIVGNGYVSVKDALNTFPRASWVRLYILHAKVFGVVVLMYGIMMVVYVPQALLIRP
jgi:hypothetical protein